MGIDRTWRLEVAILEAALGVGAAGFPGVLAAAGAAAFGVTAFAAGPQTRGPVDPFKRPFKGLLKAFKGGPNHPGDDHEDRRKTFLNRVGSPAISLKI